LQAAHLHRASHRLGPRHREGAGILHKASGINGAAAGRVSRVRLWANNCRWPTALPSSQAAMFARCYSWNAGRQGNTGQRLCGPVAPPPYSPASGRWRPAF
jgi:hypothetical protein